MFSRSIRTAFLMVLAVVVFLPSIDRLTAAERPEPAMPRTLINYQGLVTDSVTGEPVNGRRAIVFSLYEADQGGEPLWREVQTVEVTEGRFHVLLGAVEPFERHPGGAEVLFSLDPWLGIRLEAGEEVLPRTKILGGRIEHPPTALSCPGEMVDMGEYCIDRNQITSGLTWYGSADYCHARGKRLCTIREWMDACDGSPINGVEDMPGRQPQWVDSWVYETSTQPFDAVERGYFRCSSVSRPWSQYRPLEKKWFRCCR